MDRRILIVEDSALDRRLMRDVFSHYGYEILEASRGDDALRIVREQKPGLVMLDMRLPDLPGFAVATAIRRDPETQGIAIIGVTGLAMPGDEQRVLASGCDAYVSKPFDISALVALAASLLAR